MAPSFQVTFSNHQVAEVAAVHSPADLTAALNAWGLATPQPVLVIIGGAAKLSPADYQRLQTLFTDVIAPIAQAWQATVVDGGTDAGVIRLMGQARRQIGGTFALVGVAPINLAILPTQSSTQAEATALEPSHSHFLLVPGDHWGDESNWLAKIATTLAQGRPSVAILINGGEITWQDAWNQVQADRPILVIAGSGRTADQLVAGLRGESTDDRAHGLIASGLVQAIDLQTGAATLTAMIETIFSQNAPMED